MNKFVRFFFSASLLSLNSAWATNGYFAHGYGVKSQGMGGAGVALPQDALAAATNPAGMGLIGNRLDAGLTWFRPQRETTIVGNAFPGIDGRYDANETENFFIPEFGYNKAINDRLSLGISVYGNGGMNTDYARAIPLLGNSKAGINLAQLFIAPTVAWQLTPNHTIGASINFAYQRFEAKGLQNFAGFSQAPNHVTDNGHDTSRGLGFRVGWVGKINQTVTLGATYQAKTRMTRFDKYKGLFAENGDFDIPENYALGIAVQATPDLILAADIERIHYSNVDAVGNASLANLFAGNAMGSAEGPGFGWRDVTAVKLGASYAFNPQLTLRVGYNHSSQPIRRGQTLFNVLAPGVVQNHLTVGATYVLPNQSEVSFAYMHAFDETVRGRQSIPPGFPPAGFGGGEANLNMHQDALGVAYGWRF